MEQIAFPEKAQSQENLLRVCAHCFEVDANVAAKLPKDFAQVDTSRTESARKRIPHRQLPFALTYLRFSNTMQR
jgi:hypothetical protein